VAKYTPEGNFVKTWGFEGARNMTDPMALWGPRAIAVDDQSQIYVSDTGNKRIQVFDEEGNFVRQIGMEGALDGQLDEPAGIAIDDNGQLYVADTWNQRIQIFNKEGVFVRQWLVEAWVTQSSERPYIAVDEQGNIYVTDPDAFRVLVFDAQGKYLYNFGDYTTINLAGGIVISGEYLFLSDTAAGAIQRYSLTQP
jgi:DNA-binding beta-propeller fold protein YncE